MYQVPVRQSKENLRSELEELRRQQRHNKDVLGALVRPGLWEEVLGHLRNGQSVESISEWLKGVHPSTGDTLPSISRLVGSGSGASLLGIPSHAPGPSANYTPVLPGPNGTSPASGPQQHSSRQVSDQQSPWAPQFSGQSHESSSHPGSTNWNPDNIRSQQSRVGSWIDSIADSEFDISRGAEQVLLTHLQVPANTWTTVTKDSGLVEHLLSLYFCWEYPTFASLNKEHFLKDFAKGQARFCSSMLVNALLALGCRFSTKPNTRANPNDHHTSGDHFFKECQRLYYQEDNHHKLTTIQALGIMSIREASCGRDSESWWYAGQSIRLAIEMGLHQIQDHGRDDDESAVQAATFWGAFALDQ